MRVKLIIISCVSIASFIGSCDLRATRNVQINFFSPDYDLTPNDLQQNDFSQQDPGWFVKRIADTTFHLFVNDQKKVFSQVITIQNVNTLDDANKLIKSHNGKSLIWLAALKEDSVEFKKFGFVRSKRNGTIFFVDYNERMRSFSIYDQNPEHYDSLFASENDLVNYIIQCPIQ